MPYEYKATDLVEILILGAGWTSQFLVPLLDRERVTYALATPQGTINKYCAGKYDESKIVAFYLKPDNPDESEYENLPTATTVIVTFPIKEEGAAKKLVETYNRIHAGPVHTQWILLGSSSVWEGPGKHDRSSPIKRTPRAIAEEEMLELGGVVLNLAGLWGDERQPPNWPKRAITSKQQLKEKGSLHLIHGGDVARACLAVHRKFNAGERYLLTDQECYDWWWLIREWDTKLRGWDSGGFEYKKWLAEVMQEEKVKTLPRSREQLGRVLDSDEFWTTMEIRPELTWS